MLRTGPLADSNCIFLLLNHRNTTLYLYTTTHERTGWTQKVCHYQESSLSCIKKPVLLHLSSIFSIKWA